MARREITYNPMIHMGRVTDSDYLIRVMQEDDELAAQRRIMESMKPKLHEKFDQIRELLENEIHAVLRNRFELGVHFKALYDDETDNGSKIYGRAAVKNIVRVLGIEESFVRACIKFVQVYSRDDLDTLCSRLLPRGEHLSWSHIRCLLRVNDELRRKTLLEKTFTEGLTCAELAFAIDSHSDDSAGSARGRPLKIPATFDAMVAQQTQVTEQWDRRNQKVWSDPRHSLVTKAQELADDEVTDQRLGEAVKLAYLLRRQANEANKAAEKAETVVVRFRQILSDRETDKDRGDDKAGAAGPNKGNRKHKELAAVA